MDKDKINEQLAQALGLGSTPVDWPYSEKALLELIKLQQEREITKQQYFRLENVQKTAELFQKAVAVNVPPVLIPTLLSGEAPNDELLARLIGTTHHNAPGAPMNPPTPQRAQPPQQQMPPQQHQMQSPQRLYSYPPQARGAQYGNLGPPVSFQTAQRPHSPAKIGAAAVAQLERGRYPSSPVHKRTMSTPMASVSAFHHTPGPLPHPHQQQHQHQHTHTLHPPPQIHVLSPHQPQVSQGQGAMMGTMSSLQFINENPGKKRRRSDSKEEDEGEATEDETTNVEADQKEERKIRHTRTRSDHFVYESSKAKSRSGSAGSKESGKVAPLVKKFEEGNATPKGPKFANNILSSA